MHKTLYPRDDVDSMCQEKKGGEDSPALMSVDTSIQRLEDYMQK